jgi:hypothetical protein
MTTTETPLADRLIQGTIHLEHGPVTVTAERTDCPYLVIAPGFAKDGVSDTLVLTHLPTGRRLPVLPLEKSRLRKLAAAVAHLDWDFTDHAGFTAETRAGFLAARRKVEADEGEQISQEYPQNWGRGPDAIPGDAEALTRWFLDGWQAIEDRMWSRKSKEIKSKISVDELRTEIEKALGEKPDAQQVDMDRVMDAVLVALDKTRIAPGKTNLHWVYAIQRQCDTFGLAYLLAALRRVAPETADHAAAFLAEQWAAGDSLGEWVWQWRHEFEEGRPLRLPAVPSPEPAEGEFLS